MKILSLDCATPSASVALLEDGQVLGAYNIQTGLTHSEKIMPMIATMLAETDHQMADIDVVATTIGPGSFTGLRIGLATAKGLVQGSRRKLIGIPTLDVLAEGAASFPGYVCALQDARRNEVYTALYEPCGTGLRRISDYQGIGFAQLQANLTGKTPLLLVGDMGKANSQAWQDQADIRYRPSYPQAELLGKLAFAQAQAGVFADFYKLQPLYLRESEAVIKWRAKTEMGNI